MGEHLESLNAVVRELVVRRYRPIDVKRVEAGDYGDMDEIPAEEDPEFQVQYQKNRSTSAVHDHEIDNALGYGHQLDHALSDAYALKGSLFLIGLCTSMAP